MKMSEYFTDILTHYEHKPSVENPSPALKKQVQQCMTVVRTSPKRVSPIRLHDTHRSTLCLGEREPVTHDLETVKRNLDEAFLRRPNRFNS
jgi:hypothetical protein